MIVKVRRRSLPLARVDEFYVVSVTSTIRNGRGRSPKARMWPASIVDPLPSTDCLALMDSSRPVHEFERIVLGNHKP